MSWVVDDVNATLFESSNLLFGTTLSTGDDGTCVAHSSSWRSSLSGNESENRKVPVVVVSEPFSSFFFSLSTDLTDHDDTFGFRVVHES